MLQYQIASGTVESLDFFFLEGGGSIFEKIVVTSDP